MFDCRNNQRTVDMWKSLETNVVYKKWIERYEYRIFGGITGVLIFYILTIWCTLVIIAVVLQMIQRSWNKLLSVFNIISGKNRRRMLMLENKYAILMSQA